MLYKLPTKVNLPPDIPNYEKLDKAKDRYARMAIVFDYEFYKEPRNDTKLYQYLYFIFYMLACKKSYFPGKFDDYDGYAIYASREIYMRAIKFQKKGVRIKSILNYCKSVMYSMKVGYQYDSFHLVIDPEKDKFDSEAYQNKLRSKIQDNYNEGKIDEIIGILNNIPAIIKQVIHNTPYKNDPLICSKIYKSCLLSFLNSVTLNKVSQQKLYKLKDNNLIKLFKQERENSIILWHLDSSMTDYIKLLIKRAKELAVKDIIDMNKNFELPEDIVDDIMKQLYSNINTGDDINTDCC